MIDSLPNRGISLRNARALLEPILFRTLRLDALGRGVALRDLQTRTGIDVSFLREALEDLSQRLPKELYALLRDLPPEGFNASLDEFHEHVLQFRVEDLMELMSPIASYSVLIQPHTGTLRELGYSVFFDGERVELRDEWAERKVTTR